MHIMHSLCLQNLLFSPGDDEWERGHEGLLELILSVLYIFYSSFYLFHPLCSNTPKACLPISMQQRAASSVGIVLTFSQCRVSDHVFRQLNQLETQLWDSGRFVDCGTICIALVCTIYVFASGVTGSTFSLYATRGS